MKKKIKDLTIQERLNICYSFTTQHFGKYCKECWLRKTPMCAKKIKKLDKLELEVEVDE